MIPLKSKSYFTIFMLKIKTVSINVRLSLNQRKIRIFNILFKEFILTFFQR
jgi:hypothetical protein